jgi:phosphoserine phosphatase
MPESEAMPDPLPSWRVGATKQYIIDFVRAVTTLGSPHFVQLADRIATFDLDGTLWTEQPMYVQVRFTIDLFVKRQSNLVLSTRIASLLEDLRNGIADIHHSLAILASLFRDRLTVDEYISQVRDWLENEKHPRFERLYTDLTYQPMRELLAYLRNNSFRTYIVSGGGIEFARAFAERTFGIPPEHVIGSSLQADFLVYPDGSNATINLVPWPDFIDNGKRKAESINEFIGRRPIAAFGNSDGDHQMLEWTAAGGGARLMLLVHHTDAVREYGYDIRSQVGRLDLALAEARESPWDPATTRGWLVVDMAQDWNCVYQS